MYFSFMTVCICKFSTKHVFEGQKCGGFALTAQGCFNDDCFENAWQDFKILQEFQ